MTNEIDSSIRTHQRERIEAAATMYAAQKVTADEVRERTTVAYRGLLDAHLLIVGVLATGMLRTNGKIVEATDESIERGALFASYFIGMDLCERAIAEGRYLQAHALLRQEMETLAQLKAVSLGSRNANRSPNIGLLEESLRRTYDELSSAAHVSKHYIVRQATEYSMTDMEVPGPTSGSRYFPGLRRKFSPEVVHTASVAHHWRYPRIRQ